MRTAMIVGTMALVSLGAWGEQGSEHAEYRVTVYLPERQITDLELRWRAKTLVTAAYERIGVRLRWLPGARQPEGPESTAPDGSRPDTEIVIGLCANTPEVVHPGALAYARPYAQSGARITVFLDRVMAIASMDRRKGAHLLGHVLAHEIAHVLQGIARHSDTGIMKPRLTNADLTAMRGELLPFSPYDVTLIRLGLARKRNISAPETVALSLPDHAGAAMPETAAP